MNNEFIQALEALEQEKGIGMASLLETIESAMVSAYKKNVDDPKGEIIAHIDESNGNIKIFRIFDIVDEVTDDSMEMSISDAQKIDKNYQIGDQVKLNVTPEKFGRIAAQTARQVIIQRLKEAERGMIFEEFSAKQNELVTAVVRRVDKDNVFLDLDKTEAILMKNDQIPGERYVVNQRLKVYVTDVRKTSKGPQIKVSRTHADLVKRLLETEVPEISSGVVQIKSIAREPGSRTKIAVYSDNPAIDARGACVGPKSMRITSIVDALNDEKIDIILWSSDPVEYIANALSPAKVIMVKADSETKTASVVVPDTQLSLAIGREGQNARLSAKLTGWRIDIKSQSQWQETFGGELIET